MYDIYKKEGLLKSNKEAKSSVFVAKSDTMYFIADELTKMRIDAESGFIKHKLHWCLKPGNFVNYILPKFLNFSSLKYSVSILISIITGKHKR